MRTGDKLLGLLNFSCSVYRFYILEKNKFSKDKLVNVGLLPNPETLESSFSTFYDSYRISSTDLYRSVLFDP